MKRGVGQNGKNKMPYNRHQQVERRLTFEQLRSIRTYVPMEWRWLSAHPWLAHGVPHGDQLSITEQARRVRENPDYLPPKSCSTAAVNLFFWARESLDKFWAAYVKQCEDAHKKCKEEKERQRREKQEESARKEAASAAADSVEKVAEIRESLHNYLRVKGLANGTYPKPEWINGPPDKVDPHEPAEAEPPAEQIVPVEQSIAEEAAPA